MSTTPYSAPRDTLSGRHADRRRGTEPGTLRGPAFPQPRAQWLKRSRNAGDDRNSHNHRKGPPPRRGRRGLPLRVPLYEALFVKLLVATFLLALIRRCQDWAVETVTGDDLQNLVCGRLAGEPAPQFFMRRSQAQADGTLLRDGL
jgi:hypothetical protein